MKMYYKILGKNKLLFFFASNTDSPIVNQNYLDYINLGKNGRKGHHHPCSGLPCFSLSLTNLQHHLSITTYSLLQELQFERKHSFIAWIIPEIIAEPWHQFEKKQQKRPPPSLIRFATFLPLYDESLASSEYDHLIPFSGGIFWAQEQLSSWIPSGDISKTMAPVREKMAIKATIITDMVCHISPFSWRIPSIIWV